MLPLPKGEGWGEGEQHVRSRCARNVQIRFPFGIVVERCAIFPVSALEIFG